MKKNLLLSITVIAGMAIAVAPFNSTNTQSLQPPAANTGAPGETNCTQAGCHSDNTALLNDANITLSSLGGTSITSGYTPGTQYSLYVNAGNLNPRYGFELTAVDDNGNGVGTFALSNTSNTSLQTSGNRQYVGHKSASSNDAWSFKWTAPASGNIYFYLAVNDANNDGANTGDQIRLRTYKLTTSSFAPTTSGPTGIVSPTEDAGIKIFPNPVHDNLNLVYNANFNEKVRAGIYDLNGKLVMPLVDELGNGEVNKSFNISNSLNTGIYLVKMEMNGSNYFKKILVQQ